MSRRALPLKLQIGLLNVVERHPQRLARSRFEGDSAILEAGELALEATSLIDGFPERDLGLLACEPGVILRLDELALDAGGTDFERVTAAGDGVFDVQNGPHLVRNQLAIAVGNA